MFDRNSKKYTCGSCGALWEIEAYDGPDIWVDPWPHLVCSCGNWIPIF